MDHFNRFGFSYVYQKGTGKRVFLLLHGMGADEYDLLGLGKEIDESAYLLSPRGKVTEEGMTRFFRRTPEGKFDERDIKDRADQLRDFINEARSFHECAHIPLWVIGFSNGATMASALLMIHPELFRGGILFRPMTPFSQETLSEYAKILQGKHLCILSGSQDELIPPHHSQNMQHIFQDMGAHASLYETASGHGLSKEDLLNAKSWYTNLSTS